MTIRITGDGPKITATGSGSTVLVEISTGQHDPGSFSGVHNDLTGRSTTGAHVGTAVSIDPAGFAGNLDGTITNAQLLAAAVDDLAAGGGGGGAVDSVDGRTGAVTLDDLYQTVGVDVLTDSATLDGPPRTVITAIVDGTVTFPTAGVGDVGQHWHIATGPYELTVAGCDGGDVTVPVGMVLSVVGYEAPGPVYGWAQLGFKTINAPTGGGAVDSVDGRTGAVTLSDLYDAAGAAQAVADTLGTAATKDVGTTAGTVAAGDDARLSDSRTPTSHASSHASAGSDPVTLAQSQVTNLTTDLAAKVPTTRTVAGHALSADVTITAADVGAQPVDSDLTTLAGLTPTTDSFIQAKSSAWAARTIAQVQTDLKVEPVRHKYIHNQYHVLVRMNQDRSDSTIYAPGANVVAAKLVEIVEPVQLSGRWFVVEASTASAVFRPGLYASSDSTGLPTGSPLLTTPAVDASSTGYKLDTFTASSTLQPGYYWEITASSHGTAGWRGGPTYSIADMGHTSGGAIANRSFTSSWSYSSGGLPDVSAFTWTASVSLHAPVIRWRTERV